jgi:hypothetical protein
MAAQGIFVSSRSGSPLLKPFCNTRTEYELEHIWAEFEAKLSDLFIAEPNHSRVEIVEIVSPSKDAPQRNANRNEPVGEVYRVEWASTVEEIDVVLNVRHITLI